MISFKEYLEEGYKNLFTDSQKRKYAEEAFSQLKKSYEKIGGIHGSGFNDVEDFIKNIPFWKLRFGPDGELVAGAYYKDKNGRKRIAVSSDGSALGKKYVADMMISDLTQGRSFVEQSSSSLAFLAKQIGYDLLTKYAIDPIAFEKISGEKLSPVESDDPEIIKHPQLKKFFYRRDIGGELHTKIALGSPGKTIR